MTFGNSADAPFSLDYLADLTSNSGTFIPHPNALQTTLGTNVELMPDATFQLDNEFTPLLTPMPETNSSLVNTWSLQFPDTSSASDEKTLTRKDYSKMALVCVGL
jgi:hypothetical protein